MKQVSCCTVLLQPSPSLHCAAAMDQSTAILLQSFVGMHTAPAPWLTPGLSGASTSETCLPKRLQTRNILQRMNRAVEGSPLLAQNVLLCLIAQQVPPQARTGLSSPTL
jgi:hypothetical protein